MLKLPAMKLLLSAAQMREIEETAIASGSATGLELMERAGQAVVDAMLVQWPELSEGARRALIYCGPGNNGGDGYVVARLLRERGWEIELVCLGDPGKLPPDALTNYRRWCKIGAVRALDAIQEDLWQLSEGTDVIIDALFGTGLTRGFRGPENAFAPLMDRLPFSAGSKGPRVVSVDIPSGVSTDTGKVLPCAEAGEPGFYVRADLTVTFHRPKIGHFLFDGANKGLSGAALSGQVVCASIGIEPIDAEVTSAKGPPLQHYIERFDGEDLYVLQKHPEDHKFSHGHALVLSGGAGATGAARLAARAALRVGAGVVTIGAPPSAHPEIAAQITALMMAEVETPEALTQQLQDRRITSLCLGPGLGVARAAPLVLSALTAGRATVLDADALSAFEDDPAQLFTALHEGCVLTPHLGEFARLFPDLHSELLSNPLYSKVDAVREAAARAGCTVLLKGPDTVIASDAGFCSVAALAPNSASPWLATAGSGDVLAGFIAGAMARGTAAYFAAKWGATLHRACAEICGPGLIAEDLPDAVPAVYTKRLQTQ